ncbi:MAG: M20 family metallopeptidase [Saprospiraceae bacterium]|nr:M20 family metallopeptidase [Saprospiraceae bacterium]
MKEQIKTLAAAIAPQVLAMRRHLHEQPEPSYCEKDTSAFIAAALDKIGIPYARSTDTYGLVALIEGRNPEQKTIALRADFDALEIVERTGLPFQSQRKRFMHACGHDVHTSSLLGTAMILHRLKDQLEGRIRLYFEAGEEKIPGGSTILINEGFLDNPTPECIYGQHIDPYLEGGKLGFRAGDYMFSSDTIFCTVEGNAGHGATIRPNANHVAATIVTRLADYVLYTVPARENLSPITSPVISFGSMYSVGQETEMPPVPNFQGVVDKVPYLDVQKKRYTQQAVERVVGGATNVVMARVKLEGTLRVLDETLRVKLQQEVLDIVRGIQQEFDYQGLLKIDFRIVDGHRLVHNDADLTRRARALAIEYVGADKVVDYPEPWKASESFSEYLRHGIPGLFYRLGSRVAGTPATPLHTDTMLVDEQCLELGCGFMAYLAWSELEG